jgi:predicted transcriptional regulator of viral defense system
MSKKLLLDRLTPLREKAIFTANEARKLGASTSVLAYYVKLGLLERVERGIYRNPSSHAEVDLRWEELVVASQSILRGIICLTSALALYDLTEEIPRESWIAIPHSSRAPKKKKVRAVRMRDMKLGKTVFDIGGIKLPIFDRERTIVDAFRYLGKETALKALKIYAAKQRVDIAKLRRYANKLRVPLDPYLLMVTT